MARVLVVDDEKTLLAALERILADAGHSVQVALSGEEGLQLIESEIPELIIADVLMPGISGLELVDEVRANPEWQHVPCLIMSASTSTSLREQIATRDNVGLVAKPFEIETLLDAVSDLLDAQG